MKAIQYTIRNIPVPIDRYLRKRANISGQSLNQVIIDELSEKAGVSTASLVDSLDWLIGGGTVGDDVLAVLDEDDKKQKLLTKKQWKSDDVAD